MRPSLFLFKAAKPKGLPKRIQPLPKAFPNIEAFRIVRELLSERPRHTREIAADAVARVTPEGEVAPAAYRTKKTKVKGKEKIEVEPIPVPEGHPFVSTGYLKKRILPILQSQHLIVKKWGAAAPGSSMAKLSHHEKKHSLWALAEGDRAAAGWEKMVSPDLNLSTVKLLWEHARSDESAKEKAAKVARRTAIGRPPVVPEPRRPGFTLPAERKHLNNRKARRRTEKEELAAQRIADEKEVKEFIAEQVKSGKLHQQQAKAAEAAAHRAAQPSPEERRRIDAERRAVARQRAQAGLSKSQVKRREQRSATQANKKAREWVRKDERAEIKAEKKPIRN